MYTLRPHLNHLALNLGVLLSHLRRAAECVYFGIIPPQWTGHTQEEIDELSEGSAWAWFLDGVRDR